jgi:hypothetical protein
VAHPSPTGWKRDHSTGIFAQYFCFSAKIDEIPGLRHPYVGGNAGILIRHVWTLEFT